MNGDNALYIFQWGHALSVDCDSTADNDFDLFVVEFQWGPRPKRGL